MRSSERALEGDSGDWTYVLDDELGLLELPIPGIAPLLERLGEHGDSKIGAVMA